MTWLWNTIALCLLAAGLLLAARALFWDRAKGRRRCPRCWYDMKGTPGLTCPECGQAHRREADLARTRRRWRRAALAASLGLLLFHATLATPRVLARGWPAAVPTTILMAAARWLPPGPPPPNVFAVRTAPPTTPREKLGAELSERLMAPETWRWQTTLFQRLCATLAIPRVLAGENDRTSPAICWLEQSQRGLVSPWACRPYFDALVPRRLHARPRWLATRPYLVRLNGFNVPAVPAFLQTEVLESGARLALSAFDEPLSLGNLAPGTHDLQIRLTLLQHSRSSPEDTVLWSTTISRAVEVVATLDQLLTRWTPDEVAAAVPDALTLEAADARGVQLVIALHDPRWLHPDHSPPSPHGPAAPPARIRLGLVGPRQPLPLALPMRGLRDDVRGTLALQGTAWTNTIDTGLSPDQFLQQPLLIELSGDAELALQDELAVSYWEGSLTFLATPALGPMTLTRVQSPEPGEAGPP